MSRKDSRGIARARALRRAETGAEAILWEVLRRRAVFGVKWRRQHPIGPYIVDFVSTRRKVIVEVDGGHHGGDDAQVRDGARTAYLRTEGYAVLRFWNNDVAENLDGVVTRIEEAIAGAPSP